MIDQESFTATPTRSFETSASVNEVDFEGSDIDSDYDGYATMADADMDAYYLEIAYENLIERFDTAASMVEPFSYNTLRSVLWNWLPARYAGRFIAGTLVCPPDDAYRPLHISEPDKMFFAFVRSVDKQAFEDAESNFTLSSTGLATIRTRLGTTGALQYRFLMELPDHYSLADMKDVCFLAGLDARSNFVYPMHLAGCESAAEWIDLLMTRRQSNEYIDSTAEWHWRMPRPPRKKGPRKGWARRRALASIGRT